MTTASPAQWIAILGELIAAFAMLALPHITRRELLFGVPVPDGFRATDTARRVIRSYRATIIAATIACTLFIFIVTNPSFTAVALIGVSAAGMASFVSQNHKLKPYAIQPAQVRAVELSEAEPLPGYAWFGVIPLVMFAVAAVYLHYHWDQIPERFPIHFNFDGVADRWADRTARGVYGPLILGAEMTAVFFGMGLAGWYGARRSEWLRKPALALMLGVEWSLMPVFAVIPLKLAMGFEISVPALLLLPLVWLIPALIYIVRESRRPHDPLDPTPNECWKGGIIYYNPNDAALFVQRRDGVGFTLNMGNHWSWLIFGGLLLVVVSAPFIVG